MFVSVCACEYSEVLSEDKRRYQISRSCSYRWYSHLIWVLGTILGSF